MEFLYSSSSLLVATVSFPLKASEYPELIVPMGAMGAFLSPALCEGPVFVPLLLTSFFPPPFIHSDGISRQVDLLELTPLRLLKL